MRTIFVFVSLLLFQVSVIPVSASPISLGLNPSPILEVYTYDEIERLDWIESGHSDKVNWVASKNEAWVK